MSNFIKESTLQGLPCTKVANAWQTSKKLSTKDREAQSFELN